MPDDVGETGGATGANLSASATMAEPARAEPPSKPQKQKISDDDLKREEEELEMALALSLLESQRASQPAPFSGGAAPTGPDDHGAGGTTAATVKRVRALYDFTPSEPGELAFRRGDVISVLDSVYKDWWRGSLRGKMAIFPVNYVEILPDPTPEELRQESKEEARLLAESENVEKLLSILSGDGRQLDDEATQSLYHSTVSIRPRLIKFIERYSMKKDYKTLMEESMSRYHRSVTQPPPPAGF